MAKRSALAKRVAPKTTTGKSVSKTKDRPNAKVDETLVTKYVEASKAEKAAKATMATVKTAIQEKCEQVRVAASRNGGENVTSITVNGKLMFSVKNAYNKIPGEKIDDIEKLFGEENFERFFKIITTAKLNMDFLEANPDFAEGLYDAIQSHCEAKNVDFGSVLQTEEVVKPLEAYTVARTMKEDIEELSIQAEAEGLVVPNSPSIGLAK